MNGRVRARQFLGVCRALILVLALTSPVALAQEAAAEVPGSAVTLSAGTDIASAYYFRGIPQEDQGVILQPYVDIGFELLEQNDDNPIGISVNFGTWNSLHSNTPSNPWYESDFYAGTTLSLPANFSFDFIYTYYYGPNLGDFFAEDLTFALSYDDSELMSDTFGEDFPLTFSPSVAVIREIDGGADGLGDTGHLGTYIEIGLEPAAEVLSDTDYPVSVSLPMTLGLNTEDYYETASGEDNDDGFGFFQIGVAVGVPLSFIPARFGKWSGSGAVYAIFLGDSAQEIGSTDFGVSSDFDDVEFWTSWGVSVEY